MSLDIDTVKTIAFLARIRVAEDQLGALADELSSILGWVEQLNEVDTEGVAPMTSVAEMVLQLREDRVTDGARRDDVLANAPGALDGFYVVPKAVE